MERQYFEALLLQVHLGLVNLSIAVNHLSRHERISGSDRSDRQAYMFFNLCAKG
jgi:hypothetical protein